MPGTGPVSKDLRTSADGTASWTTMVPNSADVGDGLAVVQVTSTDFGATDDRRPIKIVK
jgi:hypothetical protein